MDKCVVKNRSGSHVVYNIPELGIRRSFAPGESKNISYEELEKLTYEPGGIELLASFLQISDEKTVKEIGLKVEPEYYMDEKNIAYLITQGSMDSFLDMLDFAPDGVIDLVKKLALSIPMTDYNKIKALKQKTGLDLEKALQNNRPDQDEIVEKPAERRVKQETTPGRRTELPKYNVVETK